MKNLPPAMNAIPSGHGATGSAGTTGSAGFTSAPVAAASVFPSAPASAVGSGPRPIIITTTALATTASPATTPPTINPVRRGLILVEVG
jgi:hypothetical protein